ncbi:methyl-accepting chemotaxis protein [Pseudomonas syringae]|uniref:methyl-accepting chemotaxis protein n=1 Tax=Pseudomonas syringae TaxID=317 RepID=UPI003D160BC4
MGNSDQQANRTESVAAAINELGAAAQEIAQNAARTSQQSSDASGLASDGQNVVQQTIKAMNELSGKISESCVNIESLNGKTANIGQILEVITSISQQTNLLALNAAIEAARAGEAGRGFAVVADEVRNLAHRTQDSAQQVQTMIEELQVGARDAVTNMTESQRQSEDSVGIANLAGERLGSVPPPYRRDQRHEPVGRGGNRGTDLGGRVDQCRHHSHQHPQPAGCRQPAPDPESLQLAGRAGCPSAATGRQLPDLIRPLSAPLLIPGRRRQSIWNRIPTPCIADHVRIATTSATNCYDPVIRAS